MIKRAILLLALTTWLLMPASRLLAQAESAAHQAASAAEHTAPHSGEAMSESARGEHAKPPLLPDVKDPQTWYAALWVVIIFAVLLAALYPTAWKNVLAGLKAREQRIRQDIADAEAARKKAEQTLKDYTAQLATAEGKIRDMMAKASADAEKLATSLRMQAQQDVEEIKERSTREIEAARKAAVTDIYAQAAELSTSIASKILKRNLNVDDQRGLVNESLEQLQTTGKA